MADWKEALERLQIFTDPNAAVTDATVIRAHIEGLEADNKRLQAACDKWSELDSLHGAHQDLIARAEAAERDARELRAILYEAVGDDAKDWESGDGWPMGRFLVPALAGDYATAASEFAAYNAERAAIATAEQADEEQVKQTLANRTKG